MAEEALYEAQAYAPGSAAAKNAAAAYERARQSVETAQTAKSTIASAM